MNIHSGSNQKVYIPSILYYFNKEEKYMGTIIVKNAVVRKPGFLYYIDGDGSLCEAKMAKKGKAKAKAVAKKVVAKKKSK